MRHLGVRFDSLADPLIAAVSRQGGSGRRRRQTVNLAAHVRGLAGAAGPTVSPVGFSGTTETKREKRFPPMSMPLAIGNRGI